MKINTILQCITRVEHNDIWLHDYPHGQFVRLLLLIHINYYKSSFIWFRLRILVLSPEAPKMLEFHLCNLVLTSEVTIKLLCCKVTPQNAK